MANYPILKNYIIYCLKQLIDQYHLTSPFLDVGCGIGDISQVLGSKGWGGSVIDISEAAINMAQTNLSSFPKIQVKQTSLFHETGAYQTILLMDVLEHIEDDLKALKQINTLLSKDGYVVICVPSNPKEWQWDDKFYGHYRRYSIKTITEKLNKAGLTPCLFWDVTFPVFYIMRKLNTRIMIPPKDKLDSPLMRPMESTQRNAWSMPILSKLLSKQNGLWDLIFTGQFKYFKNRVQYGHEMVVLAKKEH